MAISLYELSQRISSSMPLGTIVPYYGTDEPSGWKICDGRSCAGSELAKKLGISNVPDLRGRFLRMIGGNAAGMAVAQDDCIRNITGVCNSPAENQYAGVNPSGAFFHGGYIASIGGHEFIVPGLKFDASRVVPTGPENRPINMAFNYIIKVNTNVILYYVSNIIYKVMAVGKSLLSRAKEEVRRTMAISLNNHESRIKALEQWPKLEKFTPKTNKNITQDITDCYMVIFQNGFCIMFMYQFGFSDYKLPTTWYFPKVFKTYPICLFWDPDGNSNSDITDGYVGHFESNWSYYDRVTFAFNKSCGNIQGLAMGVLKQYYCFSNNILLYRLTQKLFDSSLLGLFSQKGGARTI